MSKSRSDKSSRNKKKKSGFLRSRSFIIFGAVIFALVGIGTIILSKSSTNFGASAQSRQNSDDKKYKATRNIVVDKKTGELRKPTDEEITELVGTLKTLTKREENLRDQAAPGGGVALDLDGGYGGTILSRPRADGTFETRCVFTFEEAIEFLGLVQENS